MITITPLSTSAQNTYDLSWNNQQNHVLEGLKGLLSEHDLLLTDVTLACDGEYIQAHKLVLSLCSSFFRDLFKRNKTDKSNTIIVLGHVSAQNLRYLLQFIYQGKVHIPSENVDSFLEAGKMLNVDGLATEDGHLPSDSNSQANSKQSKSNVPGESSQPSKTRRRRPATRKGPHSKRTSTAVSNLEESSAKIARLLEPVISEPHSIPSVDHAEPETMTTEETESPEDNNHVDTESETEQPFVFKTEPIQVYDGFQDDPDFVHNDTYNEELYDESLLESDSYPIPVLSPSNFTPATPTSSSVMTLAGTSSQNKKKKTPKRRKPASTVRNSLVWRYFEMVKGKPKFVQCNLCFEKFPKLCGRTEFMRRHLRRLHQSQAKEMQEEEEKKKIVTSSFISMK